VAEAGDGVSARVTALQAIPAAFRASLEVWATQLGRREYASLVDLLFRILEPEWRRTERDRRRWAR
jgi:hypothetical protein